MGNPNVFKHAKNMSNILVNCGKGLFKSKLPLNYFIHTAYKTLKIN